MRSALVMLAALVASTAPAAAVRDSTSFAIALGSVLGSERACGLTYDQAAIEALIEKSVDPGDMDFPSRLALMTGGEESEVEAMTASSRTAHCAQIRRIAKSYGFTK